MSERPTENPLMYLSNIQDLMDLHDFVDDLDLAEAMNLAVKCIAKPDMPPAAARNALIHMQGYAFKFKMQAISYTYINTGKTGTPENIKKNVYYAISEQCDKMAQTLKYLLKENY